MCERAGVKEPSLRCCLPTTTTKKQQESISNPNSFGNTSLNSKKGDWQFGAESHGNAIGAQRGLLLLSPLRGDAKRAQIQPGSKLPSQLKRCQGKGRGEGWTRRCHFN